MKFYYCNETASYRNYTRVAAVFIDRDAAIVYASQPMRGGIYISEIVVRESRVFQPDRIVEVIKFNTKGEIINDK